MYVYIHNFSITYYSSQHVSVTSASIIWVPYNNTHTIIIIIIIIIQKCMTKPSHVILTWNFLTHPTFHRPDSKRSLLLCTSVLIWQVGNYHDNRFYQICNCLTYFIGRIIPLGMLFFITGCESTTLINQTTWIHHILLYFNNKVNL